MSVYRNRRTQLKYNKIPKAEGCAFCEHDNRALNPLPRVIARQTKHMYVTDAAYPYEFWEQLRVDEHLLLVPVRHVTHLGELTDAERKDYVDIVCDYESRGYSVYSRAPTNIVRTVAHIHTHLIKTSGEEPRGVLLSRKPYFIVRW